MVARLRRLLVGEPRCFERDCYPAHFTASSWIASRDGRLCLLARHRKLGRWLQLGGHADGEANFAAAALREAREESGLIGLRFAPYSGRGSAPNYEGDDGAPAAGRGHGAPQRNTTPPEEGEEILDVSIHRIPPLAAEPAHWHFDIRFLLLAAPGQRLQLSDEATALRWFETARLETVTAEESLLRLRGKALVALRAGGAVPPSVQLARSPHAASAGGAAGEESRGEMAQR